MNSRVSIRVNVLVCILLAASLAVGITMEYAFLILLCGVFFSLGARPGHRFRVMSLAVLQTLVMGVFYHSYALNGVSFWAVACCIVAFLILAGAKTKRPIRRYLRQDAAIICIYVVGLVVEIGVIVVLID